MTFTSEMRALSAEEISVVAGAGGLNFSGSTNTITVTQTNSGMANAWSSGGPAIAKNKQSNSSVVLNQSPVDVEIKLNFGEPPVWA